MGRRATKLVTVNGNVTLHQRYIYRGYLQIASIDLTRSHHPALWYITWDPTQPVATRPLEIQKDGTWHTYGWDLTKNICEVYASTGYIRTAYTYTPYGQVTAEGGFAQPIQWSSEYNDTELGLIYYNHRHYNPVDGRWTGRDSIIDGLNTFCSFYNNPIMVFDVIGKWNDGLWNKYGNERDRGHSDFPGHMDPDYNFDYTKADSDDSTPPWNPMYTYLHFLPLEKSEAMVVEAIEKCDARAFELAMHYMQDFFSHYGQGFRADKVDIFKPSTSVSWVNLLPAPHPVIGLFRDFSKSTISQVLDQINKYGDFGHILTLINPERQTGLPHIPDDAWSYNNAFEQASLRSKHWYDEWKKHCKCKSKAKKNIAYPEQKIMHKAAPPQKTLSASPYEETQSIRPKNIKQKFIQETGHMLIIANGFY